MVGSKWSLFFVFLCLTNVVLGAPSTISEHVVASGSQYDRSVIQILSYSRPLDVNNPDKDSTEMTVGAGTGFFIEQNGSVFVLTNFHVIAGASHLVFTHPDCSGKQFKLDFVGANPEIDIALLSCSQSVLSAFESDLGETIKTLSFGDSDELPTGSHVTAVGYPLGQSGLKQTQGVFCGWQGDILQTDSAINPGNSGGPLLSSTQLNDAQAVVGVCVSKILGQEVDNVGYAIPVNHVKTIMSDLAAGGISLSADAGLVLAGTTEETIVFLGNPKGTSGMLVTYVFSGGIAERAGFCIGDVLHSVDGMAVDMRGNVRVTGGGSTRKVTIPHYCKTVPTGQEVLCTVYRRGKVLDIAVPISRKVPDNITKPCFYPYTPKPASKRVGHMVFTELERCHINYLGGNVEVGLFPYASAFIFYLHPEFLQKPCVFVSAMLPGSSLDNDYPGAILFADQDVVIKSVNGQEVTSIAQFEQALQQSNDQLALETSSGKPMVFDLKKLRDAEDEVAQLHGLTMSGKASPRWDQIG